MHTPGQVFFSLDEGRSWLPPRPSYYALIDPAHTPPAYSLSTDRMGFVRLRTSEHEIDAADLELRPQEIE